jgi:cupin fold WbuC family metalloprotein
MDLVDHPESFTAEGPEVFYARPGLVCAGAETVAWLIDRARNRPTHKARLCLHASPQSPVHDMIIVHGRDTYVRPHRHKLHGETLTVLQGEATAVLFDENGRINDLIRMQPIDAGGVALYRMPADLYHSLVIESEWLVFHETCQGPFDRANAEFAPWSPAPGDALEAQQFLGTLRAGICAQRKEASR